MDLADWFKGFEKGIAKLPEAQRETFFRECGKNCVQCGTLQIYKDLYKLIKTCMNRRLETLTSFSPKPMNCRE